MKLEIYHTELEINGHGVPAKVDYTYHRPIKGLREGGLQIEPDEPASVEVYDVYILMDDASFQSVDFPDIILDALADEILEENYG